MKRLIVVLLAAVIACLWAAPAGAREGDSGFVTFRGQGGVPHHDANARPESIRYPEAVIGDDEREHVDDTTLFPYSAIAFLDIFRGLDEYQCTATFIGPDVLITAAHCLWDPDGGFSDDIDVVPGRNGFGTSPFGHEFALDWAVPTAYIDHNGTDSTWDFGIIAMATEDLGNTVGWLPVGNLQTTTLVRPDFQPAVIGYPADLGDSEEMWGGSKEAFLNVDDFLYYYDIDTGGGESGSAILSLNEDIGLYVVGIHTTGTPSYNFGSRIDDEFLDTILGMCGDICSIDYYVEPFVQTYLWADADCDGELSSRDNQAILRKVLSQPALSQTPPCPFIGDPAGVDGFGSLLWADADCDGELSSRDNQSVLRYVLNQPALSQTPPCPGVGDTITLGAR